MNFDEYRNELRAHEENDSSMETNIDPREDQLFVLEDIDEHDHHMWVVVYRKFGLWRAPRSVGDWGNGNLFIGSLSYITDNIFRFNDDGHYKSFGDLLEDYPTASLGRL